MNATANVAALEVDQSRFSAKIADYVALTKPEISFLIAITTFAGFYLGRPAEDHAFPFLLLIHTLIGTVLVAGGAAALNQYIERRFDAEMRRTRRRPLASGRLQPFEAAGFGAILSITGAAYLAVATNWLASLLAILTLALYLLLYTPLKRKTPFCTLIGAIPGAMPPLIGWAAASGKLSTDAWGVFATLFLWQFPHFMAIAWMYREDYSRAGYLVLPEGVQAGRVMSWQALAGSFLLLPVTVGQVITTGFSLPSSFAAGLLSAGFFYYSARLALHRSNRAARRLLLASIVYLPLVYFLFVITKHF
jgi:protoheme IX farnesyltransferase